LIAAFIEFTMHGNGFASGHFFLKNDFKTNATPPIRQLHLTSIKAIAK
jgi:hypothetical protein